jgi:3'-5' exoribonuclease
MKYIKDLREGTRLTGIYLCKTRQSAMTKNGKPYDNVVLQDKTGTLDGKVWEPNSAAIEEFEALDYVEIMGDVTTFAGALQISIKRARKVGEGEYDPADYLPASVYDTEQMYQELVQYVESVKNPYLSALLKHYFVEDPELIKRFKASSAAKSVHHGFLGGLLEHTLSVTRLCRYFAKAYPILNYDLLITAAIFHDIGKTRELSAFPQNDYTDDGQLLGHIMIGAEMIHDGAAAIDGFPLKLENELKHCILAHHGELEYGSPKKPALAEAMALNLADNADARLETITELFRTAGDKTDWLGYNRILESNIRRTGEI